MLHFFRAGRAAFSQLAIAGLLLFTITSAVAAPPRPNLLYANPTNANVTLNWVAVAGATSYNVYMATASGVTPTSSGLAGFMAHTGVAGTSFTHPSALVNGTTYYFILTAVDGSGEGAPSPETPSTPSASVDVAKAGVATFFSQLASITNTQGANLSYTHLSGLFASGNLNEGWDALASAKRFANDVRGLNMGGWVLRGVNTYDDVNKIISVAGTIVINGAPSEIDARSDGFATFKSDDNGTTWKSYGDQRLGMTQLAIEMRTDRGPTNNAGPRQSVSMGFTAPINTVTSASVMGPGIASSLLLNPGTIRVDSVVGDPAQAAEDFSSNTFYSGFDPTVVIQSGSVFAFNVNPATGSPVTYSVPYLGTAVTDPVNGAIDITSPTGHTLAEATLGSPLPLTWTLPTSYAISEVRLGGHASTSTSPGVGFECMTGDQTFSSAVISASVTFPATCSGQPVVQATINVASIGTKGERSIILYFFEGGSSVPSAPLIGIATGGNAQATVSFLPSVNNGGSAIAGYTATSSPGGLTGSCVAPCTSITVAGLINGTSYTFSVRAANGVGNSPASLPSNSVTPAVPGSHNVTPSAGANGAISPATVQIVAPGAAITFAITANSGYAASVTTGVGNCGGALTGTPPNYSYTTITITADCNVAVTFAASSAPTTTTLTSNANPVTVGVSVTLTATVAGSGPTGSVAFKDGGITIGGCGAVALSAGSAQCTTSFASAGTKTITADYGGDGGNLASSGTLSGGQVVNAAFAAQTWAQLSPAGGPPGVRDFHTAVYNGTSNRMIAFGGLNGPGTISNHPLFNDVWVLANADGLGGASTWSQLSPTGTPPSARGFHSAVYDETNNRMMVYAGDPSIGFCGGAVNDVWVLSNADGTGGAAAWTPLSPAGGPPGLRQGPSAVYDAATNRMTVFGGKDNACGTVSNEVWLLQNANGLGGTPVWNQLTPVGGPPPARHAHSAVYDAASNRMIVYAGACAAAPCPAGDTWVLEHANGLGGTPVWTQLNPIGGPPAARSSASAIYDAATNRMTVYGGNTGLPVNDMWVLSNANGLGGTPNWTQRSIGGSPGGRDAHSAVYHAAADRMIVFAGRSCAGGCSGAEFFARNDVWVLAGPTPTTTTLTSNANPVTVGVSVTLTATVAGSGPTGSVAFKDGGITIGGCGAVALSAGSAQCTTSFASAGTKTITADYGGDGGNLASSGTLSGGQVVNAAFAAQTWAQLSPAGGPPGVRDFHTAVYNGTSNRMIAFGGLNGPGTISNHPLFNDVWVLTNADGLGGAATWSQLSPTGTPPSARGFHSAVYDETNNRMMVYAGDPSIGFCGGAVNDVWVLSNADGTGGAAAWTPLSPAGGPPGLRQGPSAVYDAATNRMTVFGGKDNACGTVSNEVWLLQNANGLGGTPVWNQLTPVGGPPPARHAHSAVYDAASNRMIVYAGACAAAPCPAGDTWVLEHANGLGGTPVWTQLNPIGGPPAARSSASAIYDAATNRMTVYGGNTGLPVNDLWVLSNANGLGGTPNWTQRSIAGSPGGRDAHSAVYHAAADRMIVFAGRSCSGGCSGVEFFARNDVWVLAGPAPTTTTVTSNANPVTVGVSVTLTAVVAGSGPTGSINFKDGGITIAGCGVVALSAGSAQCATSFGTAGTKTITADYGGDGGNLASSGTLSGGQVVNAAAVVVSPAGLPNGTVNIAYSQAISASGGVPSYSFTVTAGSLPNGLALSTAGLLSGTPNTTGSFSFTVTATDASSNTGAHAYSLVIDATVPDAPIIGVATAGDAQASISFTEPASNGGSVITGYVATCSPGPVTAAGSVSPIIVTGLTNGTPYSCSVAAVNAAGTGAASSPVGVTPVATPILVAVYSRKTHGGGDYDVPINFTIPISGAIDVEPRMIGAGHRIYFRFDVSVSSFSNLTAVDVNGNPIGTVYADLAASDTVLVRLGNVPDFSRVKITLGTVNGIPANASASMGFLVGDVNNSRSVNSGDIAVTKARYLRPVDGTNFRSDVNVSGTINAADLSAMKSRSGLKFP